MPIKKRSPKTEEERAAAIAAFGDGATAQPEAEAAPPAPAAAAARTPRTPTRRSTPEPAGDVPSTSLVRWADEDLPRDIQRIAAAEDRSFHKTMLQLLRRGVDDYDTNR